MGPLPAALADDLFDLAVPRLRGPDLGPFLPMPALGHRLQRGLESLDAFDDAARKVRGNPAFGDEEVSRSQELRVGDAAIVGDAGIIGGIAARPNSTSPGKFRLRSRTRPSWFGA